MAILPSIIKYCLVCNNSFKIYPYRKDTAKYCSHECYAKTVYLQKKTDKWYEIMRNKVPWNKGKSLSKKTRKKLSIAQKNRFKKEDSWNKGLKGYLAGEKHYRWTGGKYSENYRERRRIQGKLQKLVFERDNYTCQICNKRGGILHVDHIQPFSEYIEGRFDVNNCRALCVSCHYLITFKKPMPKNNNWGSVFIKKEVD